MGAFYEIDLFSEADNVRTTHLLLHRGGPVAQVTYKMIETRFGDLLLGQTNDGLCWSAFFEDRTSAMQELQAAFSGATVVAGVGIWLRTAERIIAEPRRIRESLSLHVPGTPFRLSVWRHLLDTPFGSLITYGRIARQLGDPNASRAVGAAVGANPIAYFIPCHRVVSADGSPGAFRWGAERKKKLIAFEAGQVI